MKKGKSAVIKLDLDTRLELLRLGLLTEADVTKDPRGASASGCNIYFLRAATWAAQWPLDLIHPSSK